MSQPIQKLQEDIRQILRTWNKENFNSEALSHLHLFQQRLRQGTASARRISRDILLDGLQILSDENQEAYEIIEQHYLKGQQVDQIARDLNLAEGTVYNKQRAGMTRLVEILYDLESTVRKEVHQKLEERLGFFTYHYLIGIDEPRDLLLQDILSEKSPWLIAIVGMGGIGKTSLARAIVRHLIDNDLLINIGWVTAQQTVFNLGGSIEPIEKPALTADELVIKLGTQLIPDVFDPENTPAREILPGLRKLLKEHPHLIVVDNLETVTDLNALLSILRDLANPSKFLLTSRMSLFSEPNIFHVPIPEMSEEHALSLIRYEAKQRNLPDLLAAERNELMPILETVGGNPLALRLVVGQIHTHSLDLVLEKLRMAQGKKSDNLYTYIYREAWEQLDENARQLLVMMPLIRDHGKNVEHLVKITQLDPDDLHDALDMLVQLNLVECRGDLHQRLYTIHSLTRTFLQKQVLKWQPSVAAIPNTDAD